MSEKCKFASVIRHDFWEKVALHRANKDLPHERDNI